MPDRKYSVHSTISLSGSWSNSYETWGNGHTKTLELEGLSNEFFPIGVELTVKP